MERCQCLSSPQINLALSSWQARCWESRSSHHQNSLPLNSWLRNRNLGFHKTQNIWKGFQNVGPRWSSMMRTFLSTESPLHKCMSATVCYTFSRLLDEPRTPMPGSHDLHEIPRRSSLTSSNLPDRSVAVLLPILEKFLLPQLGQLCLPFHALPSSLSFPSGKVSRHWSSETQHWLPTPTLIGRRSWNLTALVTYQSMP